MKWLYSTPAIALRVLVGSLIAGTLFAQALDNGRLEYLLAAIFWASYAFSFLTLLLQPK